MSEIKGGNNVKVIAYYLPQYHAIPENDKAWGSGFTEWVNTRKAKPLFEGHYQPRTPLHQNYYDLNDVNVMIEQAKLAKTYGVFGFCYYHYWFKNGKKLLEKPVEQMLKTPEVDIPFCLSWANENWSKRWDGGNEELIVEQDYGGKEEWKTHLEYFVQFFRDPRYIMLDGAPVLLIYKPAIIPSVQKMLAYWQSLAPQYGFKRFCFMIQSSDYFFSPFYQLKNFDYQIKFPPFFATTYRVKNMRQLHKVQSMFDVLRYVGLGKNVEKVYQIIKLLRENKKKIQKNSQQMRAEYDQTWKTLIDSEADATLIEGAMVDWDNTARKTNGLMHLGAAPEKFEKYMSLLLKKVKQNHQVPVVFLNAWNEWAEGAYLEPDEKYQYAYLEALKRALESNAEEEKEKYEV